VSGVTGAVGGHAVVLARVDAFLDDTVRDSTDRVDVGPLRVLLSRRPWPYYARPRAELDLSGAGAVTADDVAAAAAALQEAGAPVAFEWIPERVPSMADAVRALGLGVQQVPILVRPAGALPVQAPEGFTVRYLAHDEDAVVAAAHVVAEAFGSPFVEEQHHIRSRIERGLNVTAVAETPGGAVVGVATLQPIGATAEIVGAAVLPGHRRHGLGGALIRALVRAAHARGVDLVLLSASEDGVRIYEEIGFRRVGTLAEAPQD